MKNFKIIAEATAAIALRQSILVGLVVKSGTPFFLYDLCHIDKTQFNSYF